MTKNDYDFQSLIGDGTTFAVTWTTFTSAQSLVEYGTSPSTIDQAANGTEDLFVDEGPLKKFQYIHRVVFPLLSSNQRFCKMIQISI